MTYDKEFEEWFNDNHVKGNYNELYKRDIFTAWQAARKDHYRIGEEVEIRFSPDDEYEPATICASSRDNNGGYLSYTPSNVRRIPAKSRIDEIAEEAKDLYMATSAGDRDGLTHIIKSAILQARKEWEEER